MAIAPANDGPLRDHTPTRTESAVPRVLIADDQPDVLEALRLLLKGEGYRIESAGSPGGDPRGDRRATSSTPC